MLSLQALSGSLPLLHVPDKRSLLDHLESKASEQQAFWYIISDIIYIFLVIDSEKVLRLFFFGQKVNLDLFYFQDKLVEGDRK